MGAITTGSAVILAWGFVIIGGMVWAIRTQLRRPPGVNNHGAMADSLSARGLAGWLLAALLTVGYSLLYWWPSTLVPLVRLHDPLSQALRGRSADGWFLYGTLYTAAILIMGARAMARYRHNRYHIVRTAVIIAVQVVLAYLLPTFLARIGEPEVYLSYFWPLAYDTLFPASLRSLSQSGQLGTFFAIWFVSGTVLLAPILTYFFGKRWYCSWVCGCGGLANTAGDPFRQNSDKSLIAWKIERWTIYPILIFITTLTLALWFEPHLPSSIREGLPTLRRWYGFAIGALFSGVIGVGFYPILGTRVWCRFGCPMAAMLGLIQRFYSRFRITTNGGQCISCGNCSTYCEMGIDVRAYAQRRRPIIRASCVGCGICATVCPRGVLALENGPIQGRITS